MNPRYADARAAWNVARAAVEVAQAAASAAFPPFATRTVEQDLAWDRAIVARDAARAAERNAWRYMRELRRPSEDCSR